MKWGKITKESWRALRRHKLRSLLSMLGIVFAIIAVVTMLAIGEDAAACDICWLRTRPQQYG